MENYNTKTLLYIILLITILLIFMLNNNIYGKSKCTKYVLRSLKYIDTRSNKKYNYVLSKPDSQNAHILKFKSLVTNRHNIYFYIKNNTFFCNKKNLCLLLNKYKSNNICPKAYTFPHDYDNYVKNCKNKKMILKSNTQRQEGLFVTRNIQSKEFIKKEKIIVAQEYLQDCLKYENHRLAFRLWVILECSNKNVNGYVGKDGLVYYNNNIDPNISSFYGSYDLYDKGFPMTINELDKKNVIMPVLINKLRELLIIIKKDQQQYYVEDKNDKYIEMYGIDLHMTTKYDAYVIEINRGPGMESYCKKDDIVRKQMLRGFIDTAHSINNDFILLL